MSNRTEQDVNEHLDEEGVGDLVANLHKQGMTELDTFIKDEEDETTTTDTEQPST